MSEIKEKDFVWVIKPYGILTPGLCGWVTEVVSNGFANVAIFGPDKERASQIPTDHLMKLEWEEIGDGQWIKTGFPPGQANIPPSYMEVFGEPQKFPWDTDLAVNNSTPAFDFSQSINTAYDRVRPYGPKFKKGDTVIVTSDVSTVLQKGTVCVVIDTDLKEGKKVVYLDDKENNIKYWMLETSVEHYKPGINLGVKVQDMVRKYKAFFWNGDESTLPTLREMLGGDYSASMHNGKLRLGHTFFSGQDVPVFHWILIEPSLAKLKFAEIVSGDSIQKMWHPGWISPPVVHTFDIGHPVIFRDVTRAGIRWVVTGFSSDEKKILIKNAESDQHEVVFVDPDEIMFDQAVVDFGYRYLNEERNNIKATQYSIDKDHTMSPPTPSPFVHLTSDGKDRYFRKDQIMGVYADNTKKTLVCVNDYSDSSSFFVDQSPEEVIKLITT